MYKLQPRNPITGQEPTAAYHVEENKWIPFDAANTDYQEYLKWVAEGNIPLPADE